MFRYRKVWGFKSLLVHWKPLRGSVRSAGLRVTSPPPAAVAFVSKSLLVH